MNAIRLPNITANTEAGKLLQLQGYFYQLVEQLNVALTDVESKARTAASPAAANAPSAIKAEAQAQSTFQSIKALIIKSADIVNAYYDTITARLEGIYVAQSDFGTYQEETAQTIEANSQGIQSIYASIQTILTDLETLEHRQISANAYINSGVLYTDSQGIPVYGLEIGQRNSVDGVEVFNKYARFTADKLSFYDQNGAEVAYISDRKLHITHVEVTGSFRIGGFIDTVDDDGGVVTRWIGTGG